jgi:hypothetical protein
MVRNAVKALGLAKEQVMAQAIVRESTYLEVTASWAFKVGTTWRERALTIEMKNVCYIFPEPLDLLIGKLHRLEEKDVAAFRLVRPDQEEFLERLQQVPGFFYLDLGGQKPTFYKNAERLWPILYGRGLDVKQEIIKPVLNQMQDPFYHDDRCRLERILFTLD